MLAIILGGRLSRMYVPEATADLVTSRAVDMALDFSMRQLALHGHNGSPFLTSTVYFLLISLSRC